MLKSLPCETSRFCKRTIIIEEEINMLNKNFLNLKALWLGNDKKAWKKFIKKLLRKKNLKGLNEVFKRLNCLRRWTSVTSDSRYNELNKQALNSVIAYVLASYAQDKGYTIKWELFPKIALYRSFQKTYVNYDTKEHTIEEICALKNIPLSAFDSAVKEFIEESTNKEFSDFITDGILGSFEMTIYKAATKIATLVELQEISHLIIKDSEIYTRKLLEILESIEEFKYIPGVTEFSDMDGNYFKLFSEISKLRNQNRWAVQPYLINCSVLGHLFDTAIFAYLIGIEYFKDNERLAAKMFFIGIFHDIAERWTNDIPSPIKNKIKGFREAINEYERIVLEKNVYSQLPKFMGKAIRTVMIEEEVNAFLHKFMKGADYLSADAECWRQYDAGSRDTYFFTSAIMRFQMHLWKKDYILPKNCQKLHKYYFRYARKSIKWSIAHCAISYIINYAFQAKN